MVITNAQNTTFFEDQDQMAIPHNTVVYLANKGINLIQDLIDFNEDMLKEVAQNCRRQSAGVMLLILGAKLIHWLKVICNLLHFYKLIGWTPLAANVQ